MSIHDRRTTESPARLAPMWRQALPSGLILSLLLTTGALTVVEAIGRVAWRLPTLTLLLPIVAIASAYGGRMAGLLSAAVSSLYAIYDATLRDVSALPAEGPLRVVSMIIASICVALVVGAALRARQSSEQRLARSETMLRLIAEQLPAHVWATDIDLRVLTVLGVTAQRVGLDPERMVGELLTDLSPPDIQGQRVISAHRRALAGDAATYRIERGALIFEAMVEPLRGPQGQVIGCIGLAVDVTERERAARQLREQRRLLSLARHAIAMRERELAWQRERAAELAELDRLRRSFFALISHDLGTPMTALQASLGLLETSATARLLHDERRLLANARRNCQHLRILIDDMLTASQIEAGALRVERRPVDLRGIGVEAARLVEPLVQQKGQSLTLDLPSPLLCVGDDRRLVQVLVNLLANAHRHTSPGAAIMLSGHARDGVVVITVRDNGPGIPDHLRAKLFDRFVRSDGVGAGLGLAVVRELVELHGGRVSLTTSDEAGAMFTVTLPVSMPAAHGR